MAYNDLAELKTALGTARFVAYFDDDNDGSADNDPGPLQVLKRAHQKVKRALLVAYDGVIPFNEDSAPETVKALELEYAIAYSDLRAPNANRAAIDSAFTSMDAELRDVVRGLAKVTSDQPSPGPALAVIDPTLSTSQQGVEDASLLRRTGGGYYESIWWRRGFPYEREG